MRPRKRRSLSRHVARRARTLTLCRRHQTEGLLLQAHAGDDAGQSAGGEHLVKLWRGIDGMECGRVAGGESDKLKKECWSWIVCGSKCRVGGREMVGSRCVRGWQSSLVCLRCQVQLPDS